VVSEVRESSTTTPRFCIVGEGPGLREVAAAVSEGAPDIAGGISAAFDVLAPADVPGETRLLSAWRVIIFVAPGCDASQAARIARTARAAGVSVLAYVPGLDAPPGAAWLADAGIGRHAAAASLSGIGEPGPTLQGRLAATLGGDGMALAGRLPWLRRALADHFILTTARQNGVIGAVFFIPGADMPAMTANQIRMVLRIASAYGEELGLDRALEILYVVGTGLVFRTLARQVLDFLPGLGWAVKGAVGFSGTVALGSAAIEYFEAGAPLTTGRFTKLAGKADRFRRSLPFGGVAAG